MEEASSRCRRLRAPCGGHHEALWGSKVSPATISELNKKSYVHIELAESPLAGRTVSVCLIVGDKCMGMLETVGEVFPDAQ